MSPFRLQVEYIDLLLIHWPGVARKAHDRPIHASARRESWRVLEELYRSGKCRAIGVSNFTVAHLEDLLSYAEILPSVNQIEVHPLYQQREVRAWCERHGIAVVAYASLGCGELLQHPTVLAIAQDLAISPAQVLLRWALQRDLAVIPKSQSPDRILEFSPPMLFGDQQIPHLHDKHLDQLDALDAGTKFCWDPVSVA